jgi:hypothetical protein
MKQTLHVMLKNVMGDFEQYQITVEQLDPSTEERREDLIGRIAAMLDQDGRTPHISGFTVAHHRTSKPQPGIVENPNPKEAA